MASVSHRLAPFPAFASGTVAAGPISQAPVSRKSQKALAALFVLALSSVGLVLPFI